MYICTHAHTYLTTIIYYNFWPHFYNKYFTSLLHNFTTFLLYLNVACTPRSCLLALNFKKKSKKVNAFTHILTR
jgi:hypothetical protein